MHFLNFHIDTLSFLPVSPTKFLSVAEIVSSHTKFTFVPIRAIAQIAIVHSSRIRLSARLIIMFS